MGGRHGGLETELNSWCGIFVNDAFQKNQNRDRAIKWSGKGVLMLAITEVTVMSSDLMAVKYRSEETEWDTITELVYLVAIDTSTSKPGNSIPAITEIVQTPPSSSNVQQNYPEQDALFPEIPRSPLRRPHLRSGLASLSYSSTMALIQAPRTYHIHHREHYFRPLHNPTLQFGARARRGDFWGTIIINMCWTRRANVDSDPAEEVGATSVGQGWDRRGWICLLGV